MLNPDLKQAVPAVAFVSRGDYLAVGCQDGKIRVYPTDTWAEALQIQHSTAITELLFTPDAAALISISQDGEGSTDRCVESRQPGGQRSAERRIWRSRRMGPCWEPVPCSCLCRPVSRRRQIREGWGAAS